MNIKGPIRPTTQLDYAQRSLASAVQYPAWSNLSGALSKVCAQKETTHLKEKKHAIIVPRSIPLDTGGIHYSTVVRWSKTNPRQCDRIGKLLISWSQPRWRYWNSRVHATAIISNIIDPNTLWMCKALDLETRRLQVICILTLFEFPAKTED